MIRLYHGSNVAITEIDLSKCKRGKDFGKGFYLNDNPEQAMGMALRTTRILSRGEATLSCFDFDEVKAHQLGLKVKYFSDYCEEWAKFVVMNRKNNTDTAAHPFDIVIGPIADDTVGVQIRRYVMGYMSEATLVDELRYRGDHAVQYFFGTLRAINLLKRIEL